MLNDTNLLAHLELYVSCENIWVCHIMSPILSQASTIAHPKPLQDVPGPPCYIQITSIIALIRLVPYIPSTCTISYYAAPAGLVKRPLDRHHWSKVLDPGRFNKSRRNSFTGSVNGYHSLHFFRFMSVSQFQIVELEVCTVRIAMFQVDSRFG